MLRERLNERKKTAAEEDKYEKLDDLEDQLARISVDPTRAKDQQELIKQISALREELAWDAAEKEVQLQEESIEKQIEKLDEYMEYIDQYYNDLFENPQALIAAMNANLAIANADLRSWLAENYIGFTEMTAAQQEDVILKLHEVTRGSNEELLNWMSANIINFRNLGQDQQMEMMNILRDKTYAANSAAVDFLGGNHNALYSWMTANVKGFNEMTEAEQSRLMTEAARMANATDAELKDWLASNVEGFADRTGDAQLRMMNGLREAATSMAGSHSALYEWMSRNVDGFNEMTATEQARIMSEAARMAFATDEQLKEWLSENVRWFTSATEEDQRNMVQSIRDAVKTTVSDITGWLAENDDNYRKSTGTRQEQMIREWEQTLFNMWDASVTFWDLIDAVITGGDDVIVKHLKDNHPDYAQAGKLQAEAYVDEWLKKLEELRKAYIDTKAAFDDLVNVDLVAPAAPSEGDGGSGKTGGGSGGSKTTASTVTPTPPKYTFKPSGGGKVMLAYDSGGLVDYTGLAMVHGSKKRPEAFLSADDTIMIRKLLDPLVWISRGNFSQYRNPSEEQAQFGFNVENLTINVERLESDADYEEMAERVVYYLNRKTTIKSGAPIGGNIF